MLLGKPGKLLSTSSCIENWRISTSSKRRRRSSLSPFQIAVIFSLWRLWMGFAICKSSIRELVQDGQWLGFKDPPTGFRKPPTCPTCRKAITSPRYGRIFKRADLDILENNVASRMSLALKEVRNLIASLSEAYMAGMVTAGAARIQIPRGTPSSKILKKCKRARGSVLKERRQLPVQPDVLDPGNKKYHYVAPSAAQEWSRATNRLLAAYTKGSTSGRETRSAHVCVHGRQHSPTCMNKKSVRQ